MATCGSFPKVAHLCGSFSEQKGGTMKTANSAQRKAVVGKIDVRKVALSVCACGCSC